MAEIRLLGGQTALVDDKDLPTAARHTWRLSSEGYVVASVGSRQAGTFQTLMLHRLVLGTPPGFESDHRNTEDKLDNRRSNLRIATKSQNQGNRRKSKGQRSSKFKGVYWYKRDQCWKASGPKQNHYGTISQCHLGYFDREEDAARAYNEAALKHWGEFARLNSINT